MSAEADGFLGGLKKVEIAGVETELLVKGKGAPLLFLHGMDGLEGAVRQIDLLAESFTVYAPSHPGFGGSGLPKTFGTVDDLGYFYHDVLDHLDVKDAIVAGFSLGGWIAAEMLVKGGARVARAVLGAPLGLKTGDRKSQRVTDIFMLSPSEAEARMQASPLANAPVSDVLMERKVRNAEAVALYGWSPYLYNPKLRQRLHRIKVPVRVLWGEDDRIAPLEYGHEFAAALRAKIEIVPQCGHRIYVDKPEVAARAIRAFAQGAEAAAA